MALFSQAIAVTADGTYTTANSGNPATTPATISADGIYLWKSSTTAERKTFRSPSACGAEQVNVDITP